jgi:uncharacterized protein DUF4350
MRQRLIIVITLIVVVIVLIALNAASYVRVEHVADSESTPDRSTFNSGATGTQALYDFLHESGQQVVRWRESSSSLLAVSGIKPATFVIIGPVQVGYSKRETQELLRWVESGGRLVIIDRNLDRRLVTPAGDWTISAQAVSYPWSELDPSNFEQMTTGMEPIAPAQPTAMARNVESVMPSRFMGAITVSRTKAAAAPAATPTPDDEDYDSEEYEPPPKAESGGTYDRSVDKVSQAPVVHLRNERGALLVDYPYGAGRVVLLSDPYIVANNGIGRADNLLLAVNVVAAGGGLIAFDEFHQGRAATQNALFQYFAGTPVMAICAQLALIGIAIVWSQGRRFGRPLPLPFVDRRSKLEFVASMAELQQRAKAHDLALENIYARVRRVLVRHAGLNNSSQRAEIAKRVAARSGISQQELETLMRNCEDTINGVATGARDTLRMAQRLREIESALGLRTRARDARQGGE